MMDNVGDVNERRTEHTNDRIEWTGERQRYDKSMAATATAINDSSFYSAYLFLRFVSHV